MLFRSMSVLKGFYTQETQILEYTGLTDLLLGNFRTNNFGPFTNLSKKNFDLIPVSASSIKYTVTEDIDFTRFHVLTHLSLYITNKVNIKFPPNITNLLLRYKCTNIIVPLELPDKINKIVFEFDSVLETKSLSMIKVCGNKWQIGRAHV